VKRPRYPQADAPLPPPLPPETRTVGQLVGESLKLYGDRFWASIRLGVAPALVGLMLAEMPSPYRDAIVPSVGSLLFAVSYAEAIRIVRGATVPRSTYATALAVGTLTFVPVLLQRTFVVEGLDLVSLVVFALLGLALPAALVEGRGVGGSLRRALALARADYVHVIFGVVTLVVVILLTGLVLFLLLESFGDQARRVAALLTLVVLTPVGFLGAALLYEDQAARLRAPRERRRRRDAALHPALDADRAGAPDAEREP
jgi:hypothetical protein